MATAAKAGPAVKAGSVSAGGNKSHRSESSRRSPKSSAGTKTPRKDPSTGRTDDDFPELSDEQYAEIEENDRQRRESETQTMRRHQREQRAKAESETPQEPGSGNHSGTDRGRIRKGAQRGFEQVDKGTKGWLSGRRVSLAQFVLGFGTWAVILSGIRYGPAGISGWFKAKWLNQPMNAPSSPTPTNKNAGPGGNTRPHTVTANPPAKPSSAVRPAA